MQLRNLLPPRVSREQGGLVPQSRARESGAASGRVNPWLGCWSRGKAPLCMGGNPPGGGGGGKKSGFLFP